MRYRAILAVTEAIRDGDMVNGRKTDDRNDLPGDHGTVAAGKGVAVCLGERIET